MFFWQGVLWAHNRSATRQEYFIAELTDMSNKTTPDMPQVTIIIYAEHTLGCVLHGVLLACEGGGVGGGLHLGSAFRMGVILACHTGVHNAVTTRAGHGGPQRRQAP